MKFDCDTRRFAKQRKRADREKAKENWHRWFAWYRVRICDYDCRWLETVERRWVWHKCGVLSDGYWEWEYRSLR